MRHDLRNTSTALGLVLLVLAFPASAHGPSGHHEGNTAIQDDAAMKAQHERMNKLGAAMQGVAEAIIHGNAADAGKHSGALRESLKGNEKDVPHKNAARIGEFRSLYGELKKRVDGLSASVRTGDLSKAGAAYGKVLGTCAACHAKFRD